MIGVIVNTLTVVVGSIIGLLAKRLIPETWSDFIMKGIALCVIYIGIDGAMSGENTLIAIISMALGAVIGLALDLDRHLNNFAAKLENRFKKPGENVTIAEGFVTASLLFCVGAMTIVGALQAGLTGDCEMLYNKSMLDFTSSIIFTSTLGIGVFFSAAFVLVYQGAITLLAQWVSPLLTDVVIAEMTCVGSVIIIGIGLNLLGITKLKVMNFVPAIFLPIILCNFM